MSWALYKMFCGLSGQLVIFTLNIFEANMQWLISMAYSFWDVETGWKRCRTNSCGKLCCSSWPSSVWRFCGFPCWLQSWLAPYNLAKEDFGPTPHLAYGQSIFSLPLMETIDYLNLKVYNFKLCSSILIRSSVLRNNVHRELFEK